MTVGESFTTTLVLCSIIFGLIYLHVNFPLVFIGAVLFLWIWMCIGFIGWLQKHKEEINRWANKD